MESYKIILEELLKLPNSFKVNEDEIRLKCPICKEHRESKLYVGINRFLLPKKILNYECKYCGFHGAVNRQFLQMIKAPDLDWSYLKERKSDKVPIKFKEILNSDNFYVRNQYKIPPNIRREDLFKLEYLSTRLGRKLTKKDIKEYKIILNWQDYCDYNRIDPMRWVPAEKKQIEYHRKLFNEFTNNFVGLASFDNNKINFRNLRSNYFRDKRYYVYTINPEIRNPYFYMVDNSFNVMAEKPVINIAEGNYDILGAKELYFPDYSPDVVFAACGTRGAYVRVLNQILKMTCWFDARINIFADNDGAEINGVPILEFYRKMFEETRDCFDKITLNFNILGKDFGSLDSPIRLKQYKI